MSAKDAERRRNVPLEDGELVSFPSALPRDLADPAAPTPGYGSDSNERRWLPVRYSVRGRPRRWSIGLASSARDRLTSAEVLLLIPSVEADAVGSFLSRALRDAERVAPLSELGVPASMMRDAGLILPGLAACILDACHGVPLKQVVERRGPLMPLETARVVRDVARVAAAAHERGIWLGDIRPGCVYADVDRESGDVVDARLLDTGIGRGLLDGLSELPSGIETWRGWLPSSLSRPDLDLYAIGSLAHFALTGDGPPAVRRPDYGPEIPEHVAWLVRRCLAAGANDGFRAAEEVCLAADRVLAFIGHAGPAAP